MEQTSMWVTQAVRHVDTLLIHALGTGSQSQQTGKGRLQTERVFLYEAFYRMCRVGNSSVQQHIIY